MKLLCEAGLASEHHFDDGVTRFEIEQEHHDHLVCTRCGKIVEFECSMIEQAQNDIVKRYGFRLLRHRHELYGHCPECLKADSGRG
jgi:Fur family ferric uptake transcriptional regulator